MHWAMVRGGRAVIVVTVSYGLPTSLTSLLRPTLSPGRMVASAVSSSGRSRPSGARLSTPLPRCRKHPGPKTFQRRQRPIYLPTGFESAGNASHAVLAPGGAQPKSDSRPGDSLREVSSGIRTERAYGDGPSRLRRRRSPLDHRGWPLRKLTTSAMIA